MWNETNMLVLGRLMTKQEVGTNGCVEIDDRNVVVELVVANETIDAVVTGALANADADGSLDGDIL